MVNLHNTKSGEKHRRPHTVRYLLYKMSRLSKSIQTARLPVVTGGSSKISLWDDGNVLQTDYGDGITIL